MTRLRLAAVTVIAVGLAGPATAAAPKVCHDASGKVIRCPKGPPKPTTKTTAMQVEPTPTPPFLPKPDPKKEKGTGDGPVDTKQPMPG